MRPCAQPRCDALVERGKCPTHARESERARGTSSERGYDSLWQRVRAQQLAVEPLCRHCLAVDRVTAAREVDHMKPLANGGERLDPVNLQSLCKPCHSKKTRSENP